MSTKFDSDVEDINNISTLDSDNEQSLERLVDEDETQRPGTAIIISRDQSVKGSEAGGSFVSPRLARCCCQQPSCTAFQSLQGLRAQVLDLEGKNHLAGRYGQTLLQRHETLVTSFTQERKALNMKIEQLEKQTFDLESANREKLLENRQLVESLEGLNFSIAGKDDRILTLTSDLRKTEEELARVGRMAGRSIPELERQLERLEEDLATAQNREETVGEEGRVASLRWQQSERTIGFLQEQLERIEKDAREERERHADVLERIQRRRMVEAELARDGQAWQRPQKKQEQETNAQGEGNGVVSHFVTDILQDNANLQLGIVELREMLARSNDEIELLRARLLQDPTLCENLDTPTQTMLPPQSLNMELAENQLGSPAKQEIHVHHHYHAPPPEPKPRQSRSTSRRRGKKSISHTPRSSISGIKSPTTGTTAVILSQTSASVPMPKALNSNMSSSKRWSTQSNQTSFTGVSSLPSSPCESSVFDRFEGTEGSRPSSPDSLLLLSPIAGNIVEGRKDSESSMAQLSPPPDGSFGFAPSDMSAVPVTKNGNGASSSKLAFREVSYQDPSHSIILEENEDMEGSIHDLPARSTPKGKAPAIPIIQSSPTRTSHQYSSTPPAVLFMPDLLIRPTLRRPASHESLISVGGMDIHTLQTRPSQLLLGKYFGTDTVASSSARAKAVAESVAAVHAEYARPHLQLTAEPETGAGVRSASASYLGGILAGQQQQQQVVGGGRRSLPGVDRQRKTSGGIGGKVGGWVFGKRWGSSAPTAETGSGGGATPSAAAAALNAAITATSAGGGGGADAAATTPTAAASPSTFNPTANPSITTAADARPSTSSTSSSTHTSLFLSSSPSGSVIGRKSQASLRPFANRMPGVNQPGPIWGFAPNKRLDPTPIVKDLNVDMLRESLEEENETA